MLPEEQSDYYMLTDFFYKVNFQGTCSYDPKTLLEFNTLSWHTLYKKELISFVKYEPTDNGFDEYHYKLNFKGVFTQWLYAKRNPNHAVKRYRPNIFVT